MSAPFGTATQVFVVIFGLVTILGFVAVVCATANIVGGFLITDRMLKMFKRDVPASRAAPKQ